MSMSLILRAGLVLGLLGPLASRAQAEPPGKPADRLLVVVTDPLSLPLSCPCVQGYGQRDYDVLGEALAHRLGRPVKVVFEETLGEALANKTDGKADVVIGPDAAVRAQARAAKLALAPAAALTGLDGATTQTGLWVVAHDDPAVTVEDLKGYRLLLGPPENAEKHAAALALLRELKVPAPDKVETCATCGDAARTLLETHKAGKKAAAVIASSAKPLLEGCGKVKKGELRVVGETDPVPFIVAFVNEGLPETTRRAVREGLLAAGADAKLRTALETKKGFVALPAAGPAKKK